MNHKNKFKIISFSPRACEKQAAAEISLVTPETRIIFLKLTRGIVLN
jgi:hypothetical protein